MGYKEPGNLRQVWWTVKYAVKSRAEWQKAKAWAKVYRPGWLAFATQAPGEAMKSHYKRKIIAEFRGPGYGKID